MIRATRIRLIATLEIHQLSISSDVTNVVHAGAVAWSSLLSAAREEELTPVLGCKRAVI